MEYVNQLFYNLIPSSLTTSSSPPAFGSAMREQEFMLQTGTVFLNHGSFGVVPKKVFDARTKLLEKAESSWDKWSGTLLHTSWNESLDIVAPFLNAKIENINFVENATRGIQNILGSITFTKKDAILRNNWTYGAMQNQILRMSEQTGAEILVIEHSVPIGSTSEIVQQYKDMIGKHNNIKLALVDHIASMPAFIFPIKEIITLCHKHNILVLIDGAHCPGQLNLDLEDIGADFYVGNLHKWCFASRGCAIIWVAPKHHDQLKPVVTSYNLVSFPDNHFNQGTRDSSSYCTAKDAVNFYNYIGGMVAVNDYNTTLLDDAITMLTGSWKTKTMEIPPEMKCPFLRMLELPSLPAYPPSGDSPGRLQRDLREKYDICTTLFINDNAMYMRLSVNVYCTMTDYEALRDAILSLQTQQPTDESQISSRGRPLLPEEYPGYMP